MSIDFGDQVKFVLSPTTETQGVFSDFSWFREPLSSSFPFLHFHPATGHRSGADSQGAKSKKIPEHEESAASQTAKVYVGGQ